MVNAEIHTLQAPDGTPVTNVGFDLSSEQLAATAYATGEMLVERHRGQALEIDDVLALRELTSVRDELQQLADGGGHARLTMPLGRFIAFHDAADEYVVTRTGRDWLRDADREALPFVGALIGPLADLRGEALLSALSDSEPTSH